jgi:hypothetical protein
MSFSLITLPQRSSSLLRKSASWAGVPGAGSAPASTSFLFSSGSFSAAVTAALSLAITGAGGARPRQSKTPAVDLRIEDRMVIQTKFLQ